MEETVAEETAIEGPLIERSTNDKTLLEGIAEETVNHQKLRTCGQVYAQMVHYFSNSVIQPFIEFSGIGFNVLNTIF